MKSIISFTCLLFLLHFSKYSHCQNPVWPIAASVPNYNQINTTFAEKHSQFHGALDLHIANNERFIAILNGIIEQDASVSTFMRTRHDFVLITDVNSHLKKVRYGDSTDPLPGIVGLENDPQNYSIIVSSEEMYPSEQLRLPLMGQ